jgi:hypothetical protein
MRSAGMRKAWASWLDNAMELKRQAGVWNKVLLWRKSQSMAKMYEDWGTSCLESKRLRRTSANVVRQWMLGVMARAWAAWSELGQAQARCRLLSEEEGSSYYQQLVMSVVQTAQLSLSGEEAAGVLCNLGNMSIAEYSGHHHRVADGRHVHDMVCTKYSQTRTRTGLCSGPCCIINVGYRHKEQPKGCHDRPDNAPVSAKGSGTCIGMLVRASRAAIDAVSPIITDSDAEDQRSQDSCVVELVSSVCDGSEQLLQGT